MSAPTHEEQADMLERELGDEDRAFLDHVATALAKRGLATASIFFIEAGSPMGFIASQALIFFRPLVAAFVGEPDSYDRLARILERRGAALLLVRRLEARA